MHHSARSANRTAYPSSIIAHIRHPETRTNPRMHPARTPAVSRPVRMDRSRTPAAVTVESDGSPAAESVAAGAAASLGTVVVVAGRTAAVAAASGSGLVAANVAAASSPAP
jgi:hypothetical protein